MVVVRFFGCYEKDPITCFSIHPSFILQNSLDTQPRTKDDEEDEKEEYDDENDEENETLIVRGVKKLDK